MRGLIHKSFLSVCLIFLASCGDKAETVPETTIEQTPDGAVVTTNSLATVAEPQDSAPEISIKNAENLLMVILDCGSIGINDLGIFADDGSLDGAVERYINTCYYIQHPLGSLIWDTGLPGLMAGQTPTDAGLFQLSLERNLKNQLMDFDIATRDIDYVSISHSHFDHTGQLDAFRTATWLLHAAEWAHINTLAAEAADSSTIPLEMYTAMNRTEFSGEFDVFGDGSVIILETPGHTPGHTSLLVNLPETGPVMLSGDLYHRHASRDPNNPEASKVPRLNTDAVQTRQSMAAFEARAQALNAKVIIQHAPETITDGFPHIMR